MDRSHLQVRRRHVAQLSFRGRRRAPDTRRSAGWCRRSSCIWLSLVLQARPRCRDPTIPASPRTAAAGSVKRPTAADLRGGSSRLLSRPAWSRAKALPWTPACITADASRHHRIAPEKVELVAKSERQTRLLRDYLAALEAAEGTRPARHLKCSRPPILPRPGPPRRICQAQFAYGLNDLIDMDNAIIVDIEATPARVYDEVRLHEDHALPHQAPARHQKPKRLAADTAYGTGAFLGWLVRDQRIAPHLAVWDKKPARGQHLLAQGLPLRQKGQCTSYPPRARSWRPPARLQRWRHAALPRQQISLHALPAEGEMLSQTRGAQNPARRQRRCSRRGAAQDEDQGLPQIARPAQEAWRCASATSRPTTASND